MPTTSRGYPYPAPADPADVPADMQALAASLDTDVSASLPDLAVTSAGDIGAFTGFVGSSTTLPGVNYALVSCIRPKENITPTKFCWWCDVQSGNYDVGIIDWSTRTRLWSSGSTACPVAGPVVVPIVAGPSLMAGTRYGLVFAADNTTIAPVAGLFPVAGMVIAYDGSILYGRVSASFPIPAALGVWTENDYALALALRA